MQKLKFILVGLVLASAQLTIFAQDAITSAKEDETAKWQYIQNYFSPAINPSDFNEKFGKFLKEHSIAIGISAVVPSAVISFFLTCKVIELCDPGHHDNPLLVLGALISLVVGTAAGGVDGGVLTGGLASLIGKSLENKDGRCQKLVINFVKNWDKNREQTPTTLQPLFEKLATDNNISKIDKALAQKIVEMVVVSNLVEAAAVANLVDNKYQGLNPVN
ncbi:MAG: hypothetical protein WCS92_01110 [Candidatus Babeliales bacterium]|jgi:hypothetical protein